MHYEYKTKGVCASKISFDLEDGIVKNIRFVGGCNGNTQGVSRLAEGMQIDELISRVQGLRCGLKPTSCPDQLAQALLATKAEQKACTTFQP